MPLTPPANRAEVYMVDVRVAVVSITQPFDEIQVSGNNIWIVQYGNLQFGAIPY